jgi:uncharacterized protein (DUF58 family)
MIVPQSRLLFWVGFIILPFTLIATALPQSMMVAAGLIGAVLALAVLDALLAFRRLDGIGVELPELVRLSRGREGQIELRVRNEEMTAKRLRLGLAFPGEIFTERRDLWVALPEGRQHSTLHWPCTASRRGRYALEKCYLEALSPLGFWALRSSTPIATEIRVYPNFFPERRNLAALFSRRGSLGIHRHRQVGKGKEFEKLRDYVSGDSFEDIHWKATAKRGRPITKVYQVERTQEIYVIIDASRLSARRADLVPQSPHTEKEVQEVFGTTILERFVTAALIMGLAAERQGDLFGLLTFDDRVRSFIRAKSGTAHFDACRETLYTLQPRVVAPALDELFSFLGHKLRRRALLVFLTNLDDPLLAEGFVRNVDLICRRHIVLVNMIRSEGVQPLFEDQEVQNTDDLYDALGGHVLWAGMVETQKKLQRRNVHLSMLENESLCTQLISQYLNIKQRQIL